MRGPGTTPAATASRRSSVIRPREPRSRTVVTPAWRAARAFAMPRRASRVSLSPWRSWSGTGPALKVRWTWESTSPGRMVHPGKSRRLTDSGNRPSARLPEPTAAIRSPSMATKAASSAGRPVPSTRRSATSTSLPLVASRTMSSRAGDCMARVCNRNGRIMRSWAAVSTAETLAAGGPFIAGAHPPGLAPLVGCPVLSVGCGMGSASFAAAVTAGWTSSARAFLDKLEPRLVSFRRIWFF
jgi:hypothetical protein